MNMKTYVVFAALIACNGDKSGDTDTDPTDTTEDTTGDTTGDTTEDTPDDTLVDTDNPIDTDDTTEPPDTDMPVDSDTDMDTDCPSELAVTNPEDGAIDLPIDPSFTFVFSGDERGAASMVLSETATGATIRMQQPTWALAGRSLTIAPDEELELGTDYTIDLTWSCGTESIGFSTSDLGLPVDPVDVEGRTYAIDLTTMQVVAPIGFAGWLFGLAGTPEGSAGIHVSEINTANATTDLMVGLIDNPGGAGWTQDQCIPTIAAPGADYSTAPSFSVSAPVLPLRLGTLSIDLFNATMSGTFAPDGDFIGDISIAGVFDSEPTSTALLGFPMGVCNLINLLSMQRTMCTQCPPPSQSAACLNLVIEDTVANPADPFVLTSRSIADVAGDPACQTP